MPRYTDIDLLIDKVEETTWYHINKNGELVMGANSETDIPLYKHSDITRVLSEAPEADVVEVVRCKECIHLRIKDLCFGYCKLKMVGEVKPYNFCSYGERKE